MGIFHPKQAANKLANSADTKVIFDTFLSVTSNAIENEHVTFDVGTNTSGNQSSFVETV